MKDRSPWIELHLSVVSHRKTWALAEALKIDRITAMGHVCALWLWAIEQAQDGDLSNFPDQAIADGAGWRKKASLFVASLIDPAHYIDADRRLHEWELYVGPLMNRRADERLRKAEWARKERASRRGKSALVDALVDAEARTSPSTVYRLPSTSPVSQSASARVARDWFVLAMEREPDGMEAEMLLNLDVAHPVECIAWAFEKSVGAESRWLYAKRVLDHCLLEGHGPKVKPPRFKADTRPDSGDAAARQLADFKAAGGTV